MKCQHTTVTQMNSFKIVCKPVEKMKEEDAIFSLIDLSIPKIADNDKPSNIKTKKKHRKKQLFDRALELGQFLQISSDSRQQICTI